MSKTITPLGATRVLRLVRAQQLEQQKAREESLRAEKSETKRAAALFTSQAPTWVASIEKEFIDGCLCVKVTEADRAQAEALRQSLVSFGYRATVDYHDVLAFHPDSNGMFGGARVVTLSELTGVE